MKCLSVKQPWADFIASGRKTIELRPWTTNFRGPLLIQASGNLDAEACSAFRVDPNSLARRAVVGKAVLYDVKIYENADEFMQNNDKHLATDKYASSRFGFLLKDAVKFDKPVPLPGQLGLFEVRLEL